MVLHWDAGQASEIISSFDIIVASDWYVVLLNLLFFVSYHLSPMDSLFPVLLISSGVRL
jgi:hypothetical protein